MCNGALALMSVCTLAKSWCSCRLLEKVMLRIKSSLFVKIKSNKLLSSSLLLCVGLRRTCHPKFPGIYCITQEVLIYDTAAIHFHFKNWRLYSPCWNTRLSTIIFTSINISVNSYGFVNVCLETRVSAEFWKAILVSNTSIISSEYLSSSVVTSQSLYRVQLLHTILPSLSHV